MGLTWERENPPMWDDDKQRIVGASPSGVFPSLASAAPGTLLAGDWWRASRDGQVVGYGWMDITWGDGEVLLAVDPALRGSGIGTFILDHLTREAGKQGLRYLYNVVPAKHPDPAALSAWLQKHGFAPSGDEGDLLKRQVKA